MLYTIIHILLLLLYIILYLILYYYILYYYILYNTLLIYFFFLFFSSLLSLLLPSQHPTPLFPSPNLIQSIRVGTYITLFIFLQYSLPSSHSFYTCLYFPMFIYILFSSFDLFSLFPSPPISSFKVYVSGLTYGYLYSILIQFLTPHVLSEWMVEV